MSAGSHATDTMDWKQASRDDPETTLHTITQCESGKHAAMDTLLPLYMNTALSTQPAAYQGSDNLSKLDQSQRSTNLNQASAVHIPAASTHPYFQTAEFELVALDAMSRHTQPQAGKDSPQYQLMSSETPAEQARTMSQNNKDQLINSLRTHKVNTITELRRIEKVFAYMDSAEVTEPMTSAWAHYVNSNNLLNELRGLTKAIPFSSECVDEAKALVVSDPASVRSWNFCWLVLVKIEKQNLILKYAKALASKRSTWGNRQPTADDARRFITACLNEWTNALQQLLKHWETPPSTTGD